MRGGCFIQRIDFFGDGPGVPLVVVSPYSKGGHVAHSYADHVSILKFIERNWRLEPLSARSRDNLPNPIADEDDPYVPVNGPAISDLFVMFELQHDHDHRNRDYSALNRILASWPLVLADEQQMRA